MKIVLFVAGIGLLALYFVCIGTQKAIDWLRGCIKNYEEIIYEEDDFYDEN